MKLIIEIPDEVYNFTVQRGHLPYGVNIAGNIIDGKIVPKEYGDLIDEHGDLIDRNIVVPADMRGSPIMSEDITFCDNSDCRYYNKDKADCI